MKLSSRRWNTLDTCVPLEVSSDVILDEECSRDTRIGELLGETGRTVMASNIRRDQESPMARSTVHEWLATCSSG